MKKIMFRDVAMPGKRRRLRWSLTMALLGGCLMAQPAAFAQSTQGSAGSQETAAGQAQDDQVLQGVRPDPLEPFNDAMFTFNMKLDEWVLRPVASGYAAIAADPLRESVGRFFDNVGVIPRFANNAFQLRVADAGVEIARFGINSTIGLLGLFDPADHWFGLKQAPNDFGLTIRNYSLPTGPYLMLPFFGPSTIGDAIGLAVDGAMDPISYVVPYYVWLPAEGGQRIGEVVNYRSLHLDQFEEVDRYAVDLYGAVQDAYLQTRENRVKELAGK